MKIKDCRIMSVSSGRLCESALEQECKNKGYKFWYRSDGMMQIGYRTWRYTYWGFFKKVLLQIRVSTMTKEVIVGSPQKVTYATIYPDSEKELTLAQDFGKILEQLPFFTGEVEICLFGRCVK